MNFHFTNEQLSDFASNAKREWALTNGIGGYAGGCVLGSLGRTHQGYLIASFHPPVERFLVFSKTNESFTCKDATYYLEAAQHAGTEMEVTVVSSDEVPDVYKDPSTVFVASDFVPREPIYTEGNRYLTSFDYDGTVCFTYQAGDIILKKYVSLVQGENTVAVAYDITNNGAEAEFTITPLMNYREHNDSSTKETLLFNNFKLTETTGFMLIPEKNPNVEIVLNVSEGELVDSEKLFDEDLQFATEVENEVPGLDTCYTPYQIKINVPANSSKKVSLICHVENGENIHCDNVVADVLPDHTPAYKWGMDITAESAFDVLNDNQKFFDALIKNAGCKDDLSEILTIATNEVLSYRESTGLTTVLAGLPWFTDWGRDTMIAFTGSVLSTGRFKKAEEILQTFAQYVEPEMGLVPNMFPDDGQDPLYNTVDGSLWYFYAVHKYLEYNNTPDAHKFIQEKIYPALKNICAAYQRGTLFSIYMENDGLIHAGSGTDQVTWMDVRVGDWVVTPRHGKPVEISALWYNALKVMEDLSNKFGEDAAPYAELAEKVKTSFCEKFWNEKDGCLYDVIDDDCGHVNPNHTEDVYDDSIRPNQIYAVALPYTMLDSEKAKSVVDVVKEKLFVGIGLRSLDPAHKDYHPIYVGSLPKRDAAYHQGTAWGFIAGGFITAYCNVYGRNAETAKKALEMLEPMIAHLNDNCVGSICEIFDGNAPHNGRGCYGQAWSVGETLRCYKEDILPYL
ncbi:MAG: glycogen debranching enzyme N-terminal domain-containing protein [Agathobacter sp.]|nr:glycogen debranching enzyme N-terminal domain-containing protein [Agathobacter sp.]